MRSFRRSISLVLMAAAVGCGGSTPTPRPAPVPNAHPLASLVATGAIVAPAFSVSIPTPLESSPRMPDARVLLRELDSAIAGTLAARGLQRGWVLAPALATSYRHNPTYAPDPYALAEEPLRRPTFVVGTRLPEPLASQLRTMIALHEGTRLVLLPVQLSFEPTADGSTTARATLRAALVDPRFSEASWVGQVQSDTASADPRVLTASVAERLVDLIVSP